MKGCENTKITLTNGVTLSNKGMYKYRIGTFCDGETHFFELLLCGLRSLVVYHEDRILRLTLCCIKVLHFQHILTNTKNKILL